MKKCSACKSEIDSKATICPHCHTKQVGTIAKVLTAIIVIAVFIWFIGLFGKKGTSTTPATTTGNTTSEATNNAQPEVKPTPIVILDTDAWMNEYDKNKLTANDKYKGKFVQFSAKIKNITTSFGGTPQLDLDASTSERFISPLTCNFSSAEPLKTLENGQVVTLQGTVGEQSMGLIDVKDCNLVK